MSGQNLACCYCQRTTEQILSMMEGSSVGKRYSAHAEVLYLDVANRLACARCVSEHDIGLKLGGKPVYLVKGYSKEVIVNREAIAQADKEPYDLYADLKPAFFK